jgi:K+-sensing histidine kinase KdpD
VAKLEERSIELEQQARELAQANQRLTILDDSKNVFLNLISHEVRTPLFGILAVSELILEGMQSTEQNNELREVFQQSRRNILSLVDDALLLTEIDVNGEWFRSVPVSLSVVLKRAIENVTAFAESRNVMLGLPPAGMHFVVGDEDLLVRAMHALLETAVKFSEKSKTVWLTNEVGPDSVRLIIETEGRGIPSSAVPKFFDLFSIGEVVTRAGDLGLRAPVASRILGLFGGSVSVANQEPAGIRLTISLRMIDSQHINRAADSLVTSEI